MSPNFSAKLFPSFMWGEVRDGAQQLLLAIPSSSSGFTQGTIFTNAGLFTDSRIMSDHDGFEAVNIEFQNKKVAFLEPAHD